MKQLAIYCSHDLEDRVVRALDRAGVEGFLRVGNASGHKFRPGRELPGTLTWDAALLLVPAVPDHLVDGIAAELEQYSGSCEVRPCLRLIVSSVEKVL